LKILTTVFVFYGSSLFNSEGFIILILFKILKIEGRGTSEYS
jgi:hypothetical protein